MRHLALVIPCAFAVFVSGAGQLSAAAPGKDVKPASLSSNPNRALLDRYCVTCHNQRLKTAGVMFDKMDVTRPANDEGVWERAIRKLRGGMMPPLGMPRPAPAAVASFVTYLETSLDQAAAAAPNPGSVPIHRLNRAEYANAVKDVLGVDADAAALLPADDVSNGFDNIAGVLKVSPSFLDQYISAAREVTSQAVGKPPSSAPVKAALRGGSAAGDPQDVPLGAQPAMLVKHLFPFDGEYDFKVTGPANILTIDGTEVSAGRIHVKGGVHEVGLAAPAHSFVEQEQMLQAFIPGTGFPGYGFRLDTAGGNRRARRPVPGVEITGPYNATGKPVETVSRQKIFICRPPAESEEPACAARIFSNIAHRAFRRPVTAQDLKGPMAFFKQARATGDFDAGIQSGLLAIIASPSFLYRAEPPPQNLAPGTNYRLNDLELASRLSFFLTSSVPDDELLALAEHGKLKDPKVYAQQVRRLLASPQAESLVTNFGFEWLKVRDLATIDPDPIVYPNFNAALRTDFRREMQLFLGSIFREDHSVLDLLTANYTFANERLAEDYGIPDVRGDQFRRVALADSNRWGLLGKGAILMVTSYGNRTSPVLRGAFILEDITGTPPSAPPPNVSTFNENKAGEKAHTVRQIMEMHRANPSCNACHGVMDPLGFSLENFDSIGAWRSKDRYAGTPIDAAGKLVDGTPVSGPADLRKALMQHPAQFVQTMTEKLLMYALGRNLTPYDMPVVRKIVRDAARDNYRFSSIVMGVATSTPFEMSRVPEALKPDAEIASARQ